MGIHEIFERPKQKKIQTKTFSIEIFSAVNAVDKSTLSKISIAFLG